MKGKPEHQIFPAIKRLYWGCKPETPKIPTENIASEVSGCYYYPTGFAVQNFVPWVRPFDAGAQ